MTNSSPPSTATSDNSLAPTATEPGFPPPAADDDRPTTFSTSVDFDSRPSRPKIRARGVSLPAWRQFGDTAAGPSSSFFSYFPTTEYLQALDLPLPTLPTSLPTQLTYTSLRSSLLAHIGELEKRVRSYYDESEGREEGKEGKEGRPGMAGEASAHEGNGREGQEKMGSEGSDAPTEKGRGHERSLSELALHATPELILTHLASLRNDVLSHLPSLSSLSSLTLPPPDYPALTSPTSPTGSQSEFITPPPPSSPLATFLSTLPRRLEHLHQSLPKLPLPPSSFRSRSPSPSPHPRLARLIKPSLQTRLSSSATSLANRAHAHLPSLSLAEDTKLGLGAKHIFDLLDTLVPKEDQSDGAEEDRLMFPIWPNRTPRHWDLSSPFTSPSDDTTTSSLESPTTTEGSPSEKKFISETFGSADGDGVETKGKGGRPRKVSLVGPTAEDAVKKARDVGLIHYVDLPGLWQNNEFVFTGYRFIPIEDWQKLVRSLFQLHNETFNIHSHLISAIVVLLSIPLTIYNSPYTLFSFDDVPAIPTPPSSTLSKLASSIPNPLLSSPIPPGPTPLDTTVLCIFLLAAFKCLFCSALWHLFAGCATKRYFLTFACVDYLGIAWLIAASVNTVVYFGFYCNPAPMTVYMLLNLAVAIAGSILPFQKFFNERKNKHLRIAFFLSMALSALAPIAHMTLLNGLVRSQTFLQPMLPMIGSYFFGLWFYARHFPESRWPGKFDYFGASHNIWHSSICVAICWHFVGVLKMYQTKEGYSCATPLL